MKRLLLSVHDVSPVHGKVLERIAGEFDSMGIRRYSMLVVPDYHGQWPLEEHPDFCRWLSRLQEKGAEMVLHGLTHRGRPAGGVSLDGVRSVMFTRGEGEFLGLNREDALRKVQEGRNRLHETLGVRSGSFVAPAWLYSSGTVRALEDAGFGIAESRWRIWSPSAGVTVLRVPVANYAGGGFMKRTLASIWVDIYGTLLFRWSTLRFAVHPADFMSESSGRRVLRKLEGLLRGREPAALADLMPAP
jgi:predicted deacetylase